MFLTADMIEDAYEKPKPSLPIYKPTALKATAAETPVVNLSGRQSLEGQYSRKRTDETNFSTKPKSKPPAQFLLADLKVEEEEVKPAIR